MSYENSVLDETIDDWIGSPPLVFHELQNALNNPDLSFAEVDPIIRTDPNLAARLLKIANSSFYGLDTKVKTITHALSIVGIQSVIEMALATIMVQVFKGIPKELVDMQSFWKHSIACGLAAREIGKNLLLDNVDSLYTAGMLHDLGSLIIYQGNPKKAKKILTRCQSEGLVLSKVEDEVIGFNHAQIGAFLFEKWGLAPSLVEAVRFHHEPSKAREFLLDAAILHTADFITYKMNFGIEKRLILPDVDTEAVRMVDVGLDTLPCIRNAVNRQIEEILSLFKD